MGRQFSLEFQTAAQSFADFSADSYEGGEPGLRLAARYKPLDARSVEMPWIGSPSGGR